MEKITPTSAFEEFADRLHALRALADAKVLVDREAIIASGAPSALVVDRDAPPAPLLDALREAELMLRTAARELFDARLNVEAEYLRVRDYFELAPSAFIITSDLGIIRAINHAACMLLRNRRNALVGKPMFCYVELVDREAVRQAARRALESDVTHVWPIRIALKDFDVFEVTARVRQVRNASGVSLYWLLSEGPGAEDLF